MRKTLLLTISMAFAMILSAQHEAKTFTWENKTRNYMQYIPDSYTGESATPVIFCLHGLGDNCANFASSLSFENTAPNWIIITPEALEDTLTVMAYEMPVGTAWAAGVGAENISITYSGFPINIGTVNLNSDIDDEGFLMALLDSLESNYNINTDSIFFTGFSMGGFMSNKMGIKHGDRITAIASVSGTIGHFEEFLPISNINTLHIHGTADQTITYEDATFSMDGINVGSVGTGAEETIENWRSYNQCSATPEVIYFPNEVEDGLTFEYYMYNNGNNNTKNAFIKVNGGDHNWYYRPNNDIDYNNEILKFFIGESPIQTNSESVKIDDIKVYPNPANCILNIDIAQDCELTIYNAIQQEVLTSNLSKGTNTLDINNLKSGVYFLKINDKIEKLIIEK